MMENFIRVELKYSAIAKPERQKLTLLGIGLKKRHQVRYIKNSPAILGMVKRVSHLVNYQFVDKVEKKSKPVPTYQLGAVANKTAAATDAPKKRATRKKAEKKE